MLAGFLSKLLKRDVEVEEVKCLAAGTIAASLG
ncbi:MAG: hypothetical protein QMD14_01300 [Candidatus Aenigmarchaeota archaeon]|nr:hypothetical protein [Candidatus Aenigmarchaeota archaeon]